MHDIDVRAAGPDAAGALAPLFEAYRSHFTGVADDARGDAFLRERLERGDSVIFAGFAAGRIAGFAQLYPLFSSWYAKRLWFLSDLFVAPGARGLGLAKRLVARCTDHARATGAKGLMVEIPLSEPRLIRFYESAGYRKDAVFEMYRLETRSEDGR
jgi:GNAT superfamily N-acetyltransferase